MYDGGMRDHPHVGWGHGGLREGSFPCRVGKWGIEHPHVGREHEGLTIPTQGWDTMN